MNRVKTLDPSDLLILLSVSRTGRYVDAADSLGVSHTTVSRRISALEESLGVRLFTKWGGQWELTEPGKHVAGVAAEIEASLDGLSLTGLSNPQVSGTVRISSTAGFAAYFLSGALGPLLAKHSGLLVEVVTATRRATQQRPGVDIEIVVGKPHVVSAEAIWLGDYDMGLYANESYLGEIDNPESMQELVRHPLIYFVDSMLQIDDLNRARSHFPELRTRFASTDVFVHLEATRGGTGVGLLPCFIADRYSDLIRVLPERFQRLSFWLVCRPPPLRSTAIREVVNAIRREVTRRQAELLPLSGAPAASSA
ncbi:LysR family transcriptional regulator [Cryobacterium sp. Y50]|jgi:DNA-binding transcriptional LysR family regulator|uniref:LysR family transcriptional regulator n=1 Tax=Cryobacterium sp. Y50 TaxID=2048286 RepID=UPI000CE3882A|nr:LysR family transcriptional regulator [Cryobacterium sp. Y50]